VLHSFDVSSRQKPEKLDKKYTHRVLTVLRFIPSFTRRSC